MTNADVAKAFYEGKQASTKSGNLWVNAKGNRIYSYLTCIAQKVDGKIIKNITRYSNSTNKHQGLITKYDSTVNNVPRHEDNLIKYL